MSLFPQGFPFFEHFFPLRPGAPTRAHLFSPTAQLASVPLGSRSWNLFARSLRTLHLDWSAIQVRHKLFFCSRMHSPFLPGRVPVCIVRRYLEIFITPHRLLPLHTIAIPQNFPSVVCSPVSTIPSSLLTKYYSWLETPFSIQTLPCTLLFFLSICSTYFESCFFFSFNLPGPPQFSQKTAIVLPLFFSPFFSFTWVSFQQTY